MRPILDLDEEREVEDGEGDESEHDDEHEDADEDVRGAVAREHAHHVEETAVFGVWLGEKEEKLNIYADKY